MLNILSKLFVAPNMEQKNSVRIFTYYFGYQKELRKHFEVPLLRVGLMAIYRITLSDSKEPIVPQVMLRRTLIAILLLILLKELSYLVCNFSKKN